MSAWRALDTGYSLECAGGFSEAETAKSGIIYGELAFSLFSFSVLAVS